MACANGSIVCIALLVIAVTTAFSASALTGPGEAYQPELVQSPPITIPPSPPPVTPGANRFHEFAVQVPDVYAATSRVNESGKRHDETKRVCMTIAERFVWVQASVKQSRAPEVREASFGSCYPTFDHYVEIMPGIVEPKTACIVAHVVSVGGAGNYGKKGEIWCYYQARQADPWITLP